MKTLPMYLSLSVLTPVLAGASPFNSSVGYHNEITFGACEATSSKESSPTCPPCPPKPVDKERESRPVLPAHLFM